MYLDPGFGGMLLQVIVALVAVGGAILYSMRKKICNLFKKNNSDTDNSSINPSVKLYTENTEDDLIDTMSADIESE